jgi:hypothetical protein
MSPSQKEIEDRLAILKQSVPTRGMDRHPSILNNVSELPAELQSLNVADIAAEGPIQSIISFPQQIHRGHHYVPKQALLFSPTDVIHIQSSIWPDHEPEVTHLRGQGLMYMQITLILLYGLLEIVAQGNSTPTRLSVEFNTVAWGQISRPIRNLLQAVRGKSDSWQDRIPYLPAVQQAIEKLPLKFVNGIRIYGVLSGEQLEDLIFQPSIWDRLLIFFRRAILPNTLLLLTSSYMVVIREELKVSQGWILTYIPRSSINIITNQPFDLLNELVVKLKSGGQTTDYRILLTGEAAQAWQMCWTQHGGTWQDVPGKL